MPSPTADISRLRRILEVARGDRRADLVVKSAQIVNVVTEEIIEADIAICEGFIAGLGRYSGIEEIDAKNLYAVPGLIDGHTHIEMSMLSLSEFARLVVPRGTTAVVADPHEIANVLGKEGVKLLLEEAKNTPLRFFCLAPSCVPSSPLETSGAVINARDISELLETDAVIGLAEVMNYPGVVNFDEDVLSKIVASKGVVDGHAPGLMGKDLNAYIAAGISSDHECTSHEEALEKLRLGMWVMIREGSSARNLAALKGVAGRHTMLVTDGDRSVRDILGEGYLDYVFRRAVEEGIDEIKALQMLTLNPAEYFGINAGMLAPSRFADIVLLENLRKFRVKTVVVAGKIPEFRAFKHPEWAKKTVKARKINPEDLKISRKGSARIIEVYDGKIVTGESVEFVDGIDVSRDILKAVVVERHYGSGRIGKAFVRGFGFQRGAVAQSIAHDAHNIVAVGTSDEEICKAVNRVIELQGGIAVSDGGIKAELPLPLAGIMSDERAEIVAEKLGKVEKAIDDLGCKLRSPVITLSFIALPVIPKLKVTDLGLIDVERFRVVDVFV